ncbi:MAG: hypothetical protein GX892_15085 [Thermoanaerobacteraceae bacterium]|nr:hypothetical protein [Thermoanaerobacteraceae bacterium]
MKNIKLVTSESGDWERLIVDEEIIMEGHELRSADILKWFSNILSINFEHEWKTEDYFYKKN